MSQKKWQICGEPTPHFMPLCWCQPLFFATYIKHPKMANGCNHLGTFSLADRGLNMFRSTKVDFFLPKIFRFWPENLFFAMGPVSSSLNVLRPPLVGHLRLHPGGGGMVKGGPPFLVVGGRLHPGQSGLHTTLPWVQPTPPWLPVPPWVQFKFPRVINFDSPLNDSRQLEWGGP